CAKCIFLGSIYGNIEVNDILRCRSTISNHIQVVAELCRARIKNFLEEPYKNGSLSISPDFWCDKYKQICYLGVTAAVVDKDYKYYTLDLFFCDRGSNFLKAFQHLNPITCDGHRLNNVLKRSFFQHQRQSTTSPGIYVEKTSDSDDDNDDEMYYVPSKPVKKKNVNVCVNVGEKNAMKTKLVDAPPAAQRLIKTIV
ncbi:unnamed protein product, partial [Rotaria sp. Silwood2]